MSELFNPTERTRIKHLPKRGNFERETNYKILDEGFVCHVGFAVDEQPYVLPTAYAAGPNSCRFEQAFSDDGGF